jgi:hypothetical protein
MEESGGPLKTFDINQLGFLDKFSSFQGRSKKPKPLVAINPGGDVA